MVDDLECNSSNRGTKSVLSRKEQSRNRSGKREKGAELVREDLRESFKLYLDSLFLHFIT